MLQCKVREGREERGVWHTSLSTESWMTLAIVR